MAGDGMKIDFDGLGKHEDEIREIADKVQQAADAAGSAQALGSDAFGLVGQVFALPIQIWVSSATSFLGDAVDAGHDVADRIKTAHTAFTEHEKKTCDLINGLGKELPS
jgi:hypothetical protein